MKIFVVTYRREDGYSGALNYLFTNEAAAKKCAEWYEKHPQPYAPLMTYDVDSINLDKVTHEFIPPMTEEAYNNMWEQEVPEFDSAGFCEFDNII